MLVKVIIILTNVVLLLMAFLHFRVANVYIADYVIWKRSFLSKLCCY